MNGLPSKNIARSLAILIGFAVAGWSEGPHKPEGPSMSGEWRMLGGFVNYKMTLVHEGTKVTGEGSLSSCTVQNVPFSVDGKVRDGKAILEFSYKGGDKASKKFAVGRTPKGDHLYLKDLEEGTLLFKTEFWIKYGLLPKVQTSPSSSVDEEVVTKPYSGPRPVITVRAEGSISLNGKEELPLDTLGLKIADQIPKDERESAVTLIRAEPRAAYWVRPTNLSFLSDTSLDWRRGRGVFDLSAISPPSVAWHELSPISK